MAKTGIFLTEEKWAEVKRLLEPTMEMNFKTGITIMKPGDKEAAWKVVDEFAVANGLPPLPDGQHYGLTSEREIVS